MTNTVALCMGICLSLAIGADILANDGAALLFVGRKFVDLVEWVAFWR